MSAPTMTRHPIAEVQRLRAEAAERDRELAQLRAVIAAADPMTTAAYWRSVFAGPHQADVDAAYRRGREDAHQEMADAWAPVAKRVRALAGSPTFAEVELRRWGPGGSEHFGDPRPGDYLGGPVAW